MKQCDLAVIGASFAGLSCAKKAAQQGLNTHIYDSKSRPGAYTQSTGIFVKEIAEQLNAPSRLMRKITGVRLYSPDMNHLDLESPDYYFMATDTPKLLDWMADEATRAGANLHTSTKVENIEHNESGTRLINQNHQCKYLVAADGARSTLAKSMGLGSNHSFIYGAEYEAEGFDKLDPDRLHVFLSSRFAPGYIGWLLKGVEATQVGIAVNQGKPLLLKSFYEYLKNHFDSDAKVISGRGGPIPCGGLVTPWANQHGCLLGDAAGMVSPLTAGGIHSSIEIGEQLGTAVAAYLSDQQVLPHLQINQQVKRYFFKKMIRRINDQVSPPDFLINHCLSNPLFTRIAQTIFFHNRGLFSAKAWADIMHLPQR